MNSGNFNVEECWLNGILVSDESGDRALVLCKIDHQHSQYILEIVSEFSQEINNIETIKSYCTQELLNTEQPMMRESVEPKEEVKEIEEKKIRKENPKKIKKYGEDIIHKLNQSRSNKLNRIIPQKLEGVQTIFDHYGEEREEGGKSKCNSKKPTRTLKKKKCLQEETREEECNEEMSAKKSSRSQNRKVKKPISKSEKKILNFEPIEEQTPPSPPEEENMIFTKKGPVLSKNPVSSKITPVSSKTIPVSKPSPVPSKLVQSLPNEDFKVSKEKSFPLFEDNYSHLVINTKLKKLGMSEMMKRITDQKVYLKIPLITTVTKEIQSLISSLKYSYFIFWSIQLNFFIFPHSSILHKQNH